MTAAELGLSTGTSEAQLPERNGDEGNLANYIADEGVNRLTAVDAKCLRDVLIAVPSHRVGNSRHSGLLLDSGGDRKTKKTRNIEILLDYSGLEDGCSDCHGERRLHDGIPQR
ncbi:hypothetical protein CSUB01_08978 [Colletotrichum sublineola]|uniref:Uncharacterized protein n=1 Tax=Colletotrichum sublineola TaxID=1173701 RepID=A0A066XK67_COLSU|nr:hypothetical protein CSUB01_08978 [Colletotrichum sublineola]